MAMPVLSAGHVPDDAELEQITDQIDSLTAPGWTDYSASFTLTASPTPPTKGNSVYAAAYRRPADSDLAIVRIRIQIGSTFSAGSGGYLFSLPAAAQAHASAVQTAIGAAGIIDVGNIYRVGFCYPESASALVAFFDGTAGAVAHNVPQVWATNDGIWLQLIYQVA